VIAAAILAYDYPEKGISSLESSIPAGGLTEMRGF